MRCWPGRFSAAAALIMRSHVGHMNDQELQLRRYQLAISTNREDSDSDDIREKEAVEREMLRRGMIIPGLGPQRIAPVPHVTYGVPNPPVL